MIVDLQICLTPIPKVGAGCHELRIIDEDQQQRIIDCVDFDAIVMIEVFQKATQKTSKSVIKNCQKRMKLYDRSAQNS